MDQKFQFTSKKHCPVAVFEDVWTLLLFLLLYFFFSRDYYVGLLYKTWWIETPQTLLLNINEESWKWNWVWIWNNWKNNSNNLKVSAFGFACSEVGNESQKKALQEYIGQPTAWNPVDSRVKRFPWKRSNNFKKLRQLQRRDIITLKIITMYALKLVSLKNGRVTATELLEIAPELTAVLNEQDPALAQGTHLPDHHWLQHEILPLGWLKAIQIYGIYGLWSWQQSAKQT